MRVNAPNFSRWRTACSTLMTEAWPRAARLNSIRDGENRLRINARARQRIILITLAGLCAIVSAIILINLAPPRAGSQMKSRTLTPAPAPPPKTEPAISSDSPASTPAPAVAPSSPPAVAVDTPPSDFATSHPAPGLVNEADIAALKAKDLLIPVTGVNANQLRDTFYNGRSE